MRELRALPLHKLVFMGHAHANKGRQDGLDVSPLYIPSPPVICIDSRVSRTQTYSDCSDLRVSDTAKGCLLALGKLEDNAAQQAAQASSAEAAGGTQEVVERAQAAPSSSGAAGPVDGSAPYLFDVFLSHKRTDAKDFARALYNLLITRGYSVFLDFEVKHKNNITTVHRTREGT